MLMLYSRGVVVLVVAMGMGVVDGATAVLDTDGCAGLRTVVVPAGLKAAVKPFVGLAWGGVVGLVSRPL